MEIYLLGIYIDKPRVVAGQVRWQDWNTRMIELYVSPISGEGAP